MGEEKYIELFKKCVQLMLEDGWVPEGEDDVFQEIINTYDQLMADEVK